MRDLDRMTHPTVHEVVVGDRRLPFDGDRPERSGLAATLAGKLADASLHRRARHALGELFDPARSALSASTTLCGIVRDGGGVTVRMRLDNGREAALALHDHHGFPTYSLGRLEAGEWLWTSEERLQDLASDLRRGRRLADALLAAPR